MKTNHNKTARNFLPILKPRSHVSVLVESGDFSCCLACRLHTRLSENVPSGKTHLFKNAPFKSGFPFTWGRTKTEFFEYDDVIHHILLAFKQMPCQGCYRISTVLAFSCGRSKTIRIRYAVYLDIYLFENGGKILRFQKYPDACRTEPKRSCPAWYSTKIWV